MDEKRIKKLNPVDQKLYRNAHEFCEEIREFFPLFQAPPLVQNNYQVEQKQSVNDWKTFLTVIKLKSIWRYRRLSYRKIYLLPIGPFPTESFANKVFENLFRNIAIFISDFFPNMKVEVMEMKDHRSMNIRARYHNVTKQKQLFMPDVKSFLNSIKPHDAFCICGFSWFDFYPADNFNHILGEGCIQNGVVAFSFGHYGLHKEQQQIQKEFWKQDYIVEPSIEIADNLSLHNENDTYIYVTSSEKQEADLKLPDVETGCKNVSVTPSFKKFGSNIRRIIDRHISHSHDSNHSFEANSVEDLSSNNEKILSHSGEILSEDFELVEHNDLQSNDAAAELNDFLKTAIPINCQFVLNCKIKRRILRVATHEICHAIGLQHCQYFLCSMNAATGILHTDSQPIILCPVCLRKLQLFLNFDVEDRYNNLIGYFHVHTDNCYSTQEVPANHDSLSLSENYMCQFHNDVKTMKSVLTFITR